MHVTLVHGLIPWSLHVALSRDSCTQLLPSQLNLRIWVEWTPLYGFAKNTTFLERQSSVMSACDILHDFFYSRWASPFVHPVVLVLLLGWPFYNFKSSKPNKSASLFGRKNRRLLVGLLVTLSELSTPPLQWPDLVLAEVFVKTPHRSYASSMSLLNKP